MVEIVELVIDGCSGDKELEHQLAVVFAQYLDLWKVKHRKYGPGNISVMGKPGLVVRMNDKVQRLKNFVFGSVQGDVEGDELDAWLDLLGYAAIGVLVHQGKWPKPRHKFLTFWQRLRLFM